MQINLVSYPYGDDDVDDNKEDNDHEDSNNDDSKHIYLTTCHISAKWFKYCSCGNPESNFWDKYYYYSHINANQKLDISYKL